MEQGINNEIVILPVTLPLPRLWPVLYSIEEPTADSVFFWGLGIGGFGSVPYFATKRKRKKNQM